MNTTALGFFAVFVLVTLGITIWAGRRNTSRSEFYTAGDRIGGVTNGVAIAGDYLSASAFLGLVALFMSTGLDGLIYSLGGVAAWPILLFLFADRLRIMGRFTLSDVLATRLEERPVRIFAAIASMVILVIYVVAQLVGAGSLVALLLGWTFVPSVIVIGVITMAYVSFGGMTATTWVQAIKTLLLVLACCGLCFLVLRAFGFSLPRLATEAAAASPRGTAILGPSPALAGVAGTLSLGLSLLFGPAGLPHVLMRFFTVPDARTARTSAMTALAIIATFNVMMCIIGYGAIALVSGDPRFERADGTLIGGPNMAALHVAAALGGDELLGVVAAVVFATILAVVAGLAIAAAATVSHDLVARVLRRGLSEQRELWVSRLAVLGFGLAGIALSIAFRGQNIIFLGVMAFSIAASTTFPILFLALFWRGLTTFGAIAGGTTGLLASIAGVVGGPTVWVAVLGNPEPLFSLAYPTVVTLPLALVVAVLLSRLGPAPAVMPANAPARPL